MGRVETNRQNVSFTRVERNLGLADRVANQLLEMIVSQQFRPGDRLPPERELGEALGVSRTVVREAVRVLAGKGVLSVRSGSGVIVTEIDRDNVVEAMRLFINTQGRNHPDGLFPYEKIHEVREMLEVRVAGIAAERATEEDLVQLRGAFQEMAENLSSPQLISEKDVEFHRTVAKMAHNELYIIMLDSIGGLLLKIRQDTFSHRERRDGALALHKKILEAIEKRDSEAARQAMADHLEDSMNYWLSLMGRQQKASATGSSRGRTVSKLQAGGSASVRPKVTATPREPAPGQVRR